MAVMGFAFDMDGVITSSSQEHFEAWRILAAELGFDIPDELEEKTKGISRLDSLEIVLDSGGLGDRFTHQEKEALAAKKNRLYVSMIEAFTPDKLLPGVLKLLQQLKASGIGAVLASASRNGPLLMDRLKINHLFDAVVDPSSVARGKPAPDIFLAAAELLDIPTSSCVGVEDAIAGIQAVKEAGMYAIGIGEPGILIQADIVYRDCSDINLKTIEMLHSESAGRL
jgi:beta-phosphoglucomutase